MKKQVKGAGASQSGASAPESDTGGAADRGPELEAVLRNQLESISASLEPSEPRRSIKSIFAPRPRGPELPPATGLKVPRAEPQGRSVFAPDPVRQRTYVDLKSPYDRDEARPEDAATALATNGGRREADSLPPVDEVLWDDDPEVYEPLPPQPLDSARGRGLDARTLSIATLIGVGIGLGGLTLMSGFSSRPEISPVQTGSIVAAGPVVADAASTAAPSVIEEADQPAAGPVKEQARLTTDAEPRDPVAAEVEARVIAANPVEPPATLDDGTEPDSQAVAAVKPVETSTARAWATATSQRLSPSPWTDDAYAPPPRVLSYAPTRQRETATGDSPESGPAINRGPGVATVNLDVNIRAKPDNEAPVVAVAKPGTTVTIEKCLFWCTVEVDGTRGYIYRKFVGR